MKLINHGVFFEKGTYTENSTYTKEEGKKKTLAYQIMDAHDNHSDEDILHLRFDSLTSHDITYVGIIQTARASSLKKFPVPYVLTNCHNTLCAVGGTINEDDHQFALSAAHKYGGIYVPPNMAVIHSYNREMMTGCGRMILGSDSHTRYGALGTMGIGEGGGEIAKQLLEKTYDIARPEIVLVYVHGKVKPGVGPHDVALAICKETYANGFVKNRVMEFAGEGIHGLSQEYRNAIDVMTTETTCLSSIWETDEKSEQYFEIHGRKEAYRKLEVEDGAYYDRCIDLDLSEIECMIALPMHPSYALPINTLKENPLKYLKEAEDNANAQLAHANMNLVSKVRKDGSIVVDQGIIAGCSGGTYANIKAAASILKNGDCGSEEYRLSIYPDSMPVYKALVQNSTVSDLVSSGAILREAFCGPCFGAGDTPANNELSIRHTTRNFANREGSKPNEGQIASVCLMDARSIAATSINKGVLTAATDICKEDEEEYVCSFDSSLYERRVFNGFGKEEPEYPLHFGPDIKDWPEQPALSDDILLKIVSHIDDPVTTTDELIPSGETSSYRSNPLRLAEFTLSRRDPQYVNEAKSVQKMDFNNSEVQHICSLLEKEGISVNQNTNIASSIYAYKPGDGSAREQAASCQRVLGAGANFAHEYATKRYRSNCINWGMLPFLTTDDDLLQKSSWVLVKDVKIGLETGSNMTAYVIANDSVTEIKVSCGDLTKDEVQILEDGCLINYYKAD
ncbi:MAG: hydratase [Bulleidia sp.]|nr:hydratase [Bulleidia sp.]